MNVASHRTPQLEVCCGDLDSVLAARAGGARRIELCAALGEGGLTPSAALIQAACETGIPEVNVLIRPRSGDFVYTPAETALMARDIGTAIRAGATGVVIGALRPDGTVDTETCRLLVGTACAAAAECGFDNEARPFNITFHRAFDLARDAAEALEQIIALGCTGLLTSGMAPTAVQGSECLRHMVQLSAGRLCVIAAGGINAANAAAVARATGAPCLHASARHTVASSMAFRRAGVSMGAPGADEYARSVTSSGAVSAIINVLDSL